MEEPIKEIPQAIGNTMECPNCHLKITHTAKFCPGCGTKIEPQGPSFA